MTKYFLKTTGGYVGTDNRQEITEWFTDKDYQVYQGLEGTKKEQNRLSDNLLGYAIEQ